MTLKASASSLCFVVASAAISQNALVPASPADRAEARDIFKQLIEINSTDTPKGSVTAASKAMERRFLAAGFPREDVRLLGPAAHKQNLVVRYRPAGTPDSRPVL